MSEYDVVLDRPHNGPGAKVYLAKEGGYLTLKSVPIVDLKNEDNNNIVRHDDNNVRVVVGLRSYGFYIPAKSNSETILLQNFWIDAGEEVWASVRYVNTLAVYGFTTSKPTNAC